MLVHVANTTCLSVLFRKIDDMVLWLIGCTHWPCIATKTDVISLELCIPRLKSDLFEHYFQTWKSLLGDNYSYMEYITQRIHGHFHAHNFVLYKTNEKTFHVKLFFEKKTKISLAQNIKKKIYMNSHWQVDCSTMTETTMETTKEWARQETRI